MNPFTASRFGILMFSVVLIILATGTVFSSLNEHDVLLVVNDQSPISVAIADYYKLIRGIPDANICHLSACPTNESIDAVTWYDRIKMPIWDYLNHESHPWLKDQVKTILLTKGVPLQVWTEVSRGSSVDMTLCYIGNNCNAGFEPIGGIIPSNTYFSQDQAFAEFRPSTANIDPQKSKTYFPGLDYIFGFGSNAIIASGQKGVMVRSTNTYNWPAVSDRARAFTGTALNATTTYETTGWAILDSYASGSSYLGGLILKSINNGEDWSVVRSRTLGTTLYSISFANANVGWAVGKQGDQALALYTNGGGNWNWQSMNLSSLSLPGCTLRGVCTTGTDSVVACGTSGVIIRGVKSGSNWSWSKITTVPSVDYNSISLKQDDNTYVGWIVGDNGKILKTIDGGTTWQTQDSQTTLSLSKIYAYNDSCAWITTGSSTILKTINGGLTWQTITLPTEQIIKSIYFVDSYIGFAVCGNNKILLSTDGGNVWDTTFQGEDTLWKMNYLVCRLRVHPKTQVMRLIMIISACI